MPCLPGCSTNTSVASRVDHLETARLINKVQHFACAAIVGLKLEEAQTHILSMGDPVSISPNFQRSSGNLNVNRAGRPVAF